MFHRSSAPYYKIRASKSLITSFNFFSRHYYLDSLTLVLAWLQIAYLTPLLHSLKYPAASVNGVLLGKSARSNDSVKITVIEAIPLLHAHIALSPMMDAAFCILDEYCRFTPFPTAHVFLN